MKKIFLLSLSLTACAILAQATTITCTVITGGAVSDGSNTAVIAGGTLSSTPVFNCGPIDAGAGNLLTNVFLQGASGFDGGPFGTTSGTTVVEVFNSDSPFNNGNNPLTETMNGGNVSNSWNPGIPFQLGNTLNPGTQTLAGFQVSLSSAVTAGGPVGSSTAQMVLNYTSTPIQGTPEPATLGLMGSALLGLGFLVRRKK